MNTCVELQITPNNNIPAVYGAGDYFSANDLTIYLLIEDIDDTDEDDCLRLVSLMDGKTLDTYFGCSFVTLEKISESVKEHYDSIVPKSDINIRHINFVKVIAQ